MVRVALVLCVLLLTICHTRARLAFYMTGTYPNREQAARNHDDDGDDEEFQNLYDECIQHYATCKRYGDECMSCANSCFIAASSTDDEDLKTKLSNMAVECQSGEFDEEEDSMLHSSLPRQFSWRASRTCYERSIMLFRTMF